MNVDAYRYDIICILNPLVGNRFQCMALLHSRTRHHMINNNEITQNNCFVKESHKCDVYLRDKHKARNKDRISIFI